MPNKKFSALTAATNAQMRMPYPTGAGLVVRGLPLYTQAGVANRRSFAEQFLQSAAVNLFSPATNLKSGAVTTVAVPAGYTFYLEGVFVIAASIAALVTQPRLSFGITGDDVKYVDNLDMTLLTQSNTLEFIGVTGTDGETSLTATVEIAANATTCTGYFGWRGILFQV